jgi:hypothetical protein
VVAQASHCHRPPSGPAFGRPDDRLRRTIEGETRWRMMTALYVAAADCAFAHPPYPLRIALHAPRGSIMNENRYYGVRVESAKYGVGFGSALAIAISYTNNHSILWAIIHGILGWLYVIYVALFG